MINAASCQHAIPWQLLAEPTESECRRFLGMAGLMSENQKSSGFVT